jgi:carbon-monoxide dehydrogenase iron sulfur subunit
MFACARRQGDVGLAKSCLAVKSIGGMEKGFIVVVCRACEDPPCARVCPTGALQAREDGGVIFNTDACIGCGNCRDTCLIGAIFWDEEVNRPMICIHCGYCVEFCPHGVLTLEERNIISDAGK